mmetsp:Transcript_32751/g.71895  ORF Transcript_32751/g.71895 Transcript_32751/m.71895 type:complete len:353 (+) Transcript_32751:120-1178(+)
MHKVKVERGGGDAELGCACKTHVPCAVWAADGARARSERVLRGLRAASDVLLPPLEHALEARDGAHDVDHLLLALGPALVVGLFAGDVEHLGLLRFGRGRALGRCAVVRAVRKFVAPGLRHLAAETLAGCLRLLVRARQWCVDLVARLPRGQPASDDASGTKGEVGARGGAGGDARARVCGGDGDGGERPQLLLVPARREHVGAADEEVVGEDEPLILPPYAPVWARNRGAVALHVDEHLAQERARVLKQQLDVVRLDLLGEHLHHVQPTLHISNVLVHLAVERLHPLKGLEAELVQRQALGGRVDHPLENERVEAHALHRTEEQRLERGLVLGVLAVHQRVHLGLLPHRRQ